MIELRYDLEDLDKPLTDIFTDHPVKWNYLINFKAIIGSMFSNLERLFKGCFGQDIDCDCTDVQYAVFRRIFPVLGEIFDKADGKDSMRSMCTRLLQIRNNCAHAHATLMKGAIFFDQRLIDGLPNYSNHIYADEEGKLTLAGLLAILLCMSNKEMLGFMAASGLSQLVQEIGLFPDYKSYYGKEFSAHLEEAIHTDLDVDIRQQQGNDILSALWGEYLPRVQINGEEFSFINGNDLEHSLHIIYGSLTKNTLIKGKDAWILKINKGCYYHLYFPDGFILMIEDGQYFIELANKVPPFMLVPYLYHLGIDHVRRDCLTQSQLIQLEKINKAKFYVDKNINILTLGNAVADQRTTSQAAMPQVLYCLLNLENNIVWRHGDLLDQEKFYSSLPDTLRAMKLEQELIDDVVGIRNFFAHGFILGDYYGRALRSYKRYDLIDVLAVFKKLAESFKDTDVFIGRRFREDVSFRVAEQLADLKYKDYARKWDRIIYYHETIEETQMLKSLARIKNSYINEEAEQALSWFFDDKTFARFTVFEIEIHPGTILECNKQAFFSDRLFITGMKKNIPMHLVFGEDWESKFQCAAFNKNPILRYRKYIMA